MGQKKRTRVRQSWGLSVLLVFSLTLCIPLVPASPAHSQLNSPPSFSSATYLLASSENPTPVRPVGDPFVANDPDPHDRLTYTLSGEDAMFFNIAETSGQLETKEPLDYETRSSYLVEVRATDPGGLYDTASVNINVTNVDEAGSIVPTPIMTNIGAGALATLTDPDGSLSNVSWQWSVSSDKTTWRHIEGAVSASYVPREEDLRQFLQIRAAYGDGHGPGKLASKVFDASLLLGDNHPPEFPFSESGVRKIEANIPSGGKVGGPLLAGDLDGDLLTYGLTGEAALFFEIEPHTGQIRTKTTLDDRFEGRHFGEVHVFDGKGGSVTKVVRIDVGYIPVSVSAPASETEAGPTMTPLAAMTEPPNADSAALSGNHLQAQPQLQATTSEPGRGFNAPGGNDRVDASADNSQEPLEPRAVDEPNPEDHEEPVAAMVMNSPPALPALEGAQTGAVGPPGGNGQADPAGESGPGSLFRWVVWFCLSALLLAGILLLLMKLRRHYRREVKLPPPTIGPERRIGSLPFIVSLPEEGVVSQASNGEESRSEADPDTEGGHPRLSPAN